MLVCYLNEVICVSFLFFCINFAGQLNLILGGYVNKLIKVMGDVKRKYSVSVIIPVNNTEPYLKRCVESVRNQILNDIEIILVENNSQDDSPAICDAYAEIDSRVKVLHISDVGLSRARNAGIKVASAPYIGFVDSDDYISEAMFHDLLNAIETNHAEIAYCNFCYEYEDGRIDHPYINSEKIFVRQAKEVVEDIICEKVSSSSCTKLFKKEVFESLLFPEGVFFEDHAVVYKWMSICRKVVWIDCTYYYYYQRAGSICHTINLDKHYHFFLAEYDRLGFVKENNLFVDARRSEVINLIVQTCFSHFSDFMKDAKLVRDRKAIKDMRCKMKGWLSLRPNEVEKWVYRRVRKIVYYWIFYYWRHYYKK